MFRDIILRNGTRGWLQYNARMQHTTLVSCLNFRTFCCDLLAYLMFLNREPAQ